MVRATLLLGLALAGCAGAPPAPPKHDELLAAAGGQYGGIERQPVPVLRRYCMSAWWARDAAALEACLAELQARRTWLGAERPAACATPGEPGTPARHACDLLGRELHLGALAALDRGDYEAAVQRASDLRAMRRERSDFRHEAVDALGILAVAHALAGDAPRARERLRELEAFGFGPFSGLHFERIWLARAHMALGDWAKAYEEARRLTFGFDALVERTATAYAPTDEADGYRFILGKSALETGRREEALAGLTPLMNSRTPSLAPSKTGRLISSEDLARDFARAQAR